MEISAVVKDLKTGRQAQIDFPASVEEVRVRIGLDDRADFEYVFVNDDHGLIGEYDSIEMVNHFAEMVLTIDDDVVLAVQEVLGYKAKDFVDYEFNFEDCVLIPDVHSHRELGEYWFDELDLNRENKEILEQYFDYEAYGRDIDLEEQGGFSSKGYLEIR